MPLPVCACLSLCWRVCASLCECRRSHPRHTNVINKVKLLLGRENEEYTHTHTQAHANTCTHTSTQTDRDKEASIRGHKYGIAQIE